MTLKSIYISCKTARLLKEFLGNDIPEPLAYYAHWTKHAGIRKINLQSKLKKCWLKSGSSKQYPAYQLHDLLGKPFCEAWNKTIFGCGTTAPWVKR